MLTFLNTTDTSAITLDFGSIKTIGTINEENNIEISFNFNFKMVLGFSTVIRLSFETQKCHSLTTVNEMFCPVFQLWESKSGMIWIELNSY